jgi:YVTN family beta-propeller protein
MCEFKRLVMAGVATAALLGMTGAAGAHDWKRHLYVPNMTSDTVAVIDTTDNRVIDQIAVGKTPHQVSVSLETHRMIASNTGDDTVSIIDLHDREVVATLGLDAEPEHMAMAPDGRSVAIGNIAAGTVSLVDLVAARVTARIEGLVQPHNLTYSSDGSRLYVANLGAEHVSLVDVATARVIGEIPVGEGAAIASRGRAEEYQGIVAVTPSVDGRLGFAAHGESGKLAVIDLESGAKLASLNLGGEPWRAYASPDGRWMVVPKNGDASVAVIDVQSRAVVATLPGGRDMTGVNFSNDGGEALVLSRGDKRILRLDLAAMKSLGGIDLPGTPETSAVAHGSDRLYVALSDIDRVAIIDIAQGRLVGLIDGVGDAPWGATLAGGRNYCH